MRYKECAAPKFWWVWLGVMFVLLLVPLCWLPELNPAEARLALLAREMLSSGDYLTPRLFGNPAFAFPISPWLLSVIFRFLPEGEGSILFVVGTVRMVSILPIGLLAILTGSVCAKLGGRHAGAVAAATCISTGVVVFQKGVEGDGTMLFALLINCAWFLWFYLGRVRRMWLFAWFFSLLIIGVAILTFGAKALFLFYFPLFWLRKPIRIWRRLSHWEHWISLVGAAVVLGLWIALVPTLKSDFANFFRSWLAQGDFGSYFKRLVTFPVMALLGMFPWIFLVWPAFCQAFRPLEKQPAFTGYMRTIVTSIFVFYWLIPGIDTNDLLPLIGPFAVMVAMNYEMLVRRYGPELWLIVRACAWTTVLLGVACVAIDMFFLQIDREMLHPSVRTQAAFLFLVGFILAILCIKITPKLPMWMMVLVSVLMVKMVYSGTFTVYESLTERRSHELAAQLSEPLPEDGTVYVVLKDRPVTSSWNELDSEVPSAESFHASKFTKEWFYLNRKVLVKEAVGERPGEQEVYVIGGELEPLAAEREWEALTEPLHYHDGDVFRLWKGTKSEEKTYWRARDVVKPPYPPPYHVSVDSWKSAKGGSLVQSTPELQPRWLALNGQPTIRFEGNNILGRIEPDFLDAVGTEHCYFIAVGLSNGIGKQVILDISSLDDQGQDVQTISYDGQKMELVVAASGGDGKTGQFSAYADLSEPSVIVLRRRKEAVDLFVWNHSKSPESAAFLPAASMEGEFELRDLKPVRISLGAAWAGNTYQDFLVGDISEMRVHNVQLSDEKIRRIAESIHASNFGE